MGHRTSKVGDFVVTRVVETKSRVLKCRNIAIASNLSDYYSYTDMVDQIEKKQSVLEH